MWHKLQNNISLKHQSWPASAVSRTCDQNLTEAWSASFQSTLRTSEGLWQESVTHLSATHHARGHTIRSSCYCYRHAADKYIHEADKEQTYSWQGTDMLLTRYTDMQLTRYRYAAEKVRTCGWQGTDMQLTRYRHACSWQDTDMQLTRYRHSAARYRHAADKYIHVADKVQTCSW